jgi:hypothetical protein
MGFCQNYASKKINILICLSEYSQDSVGIWKNMLPFVAPDGFIRNTELSYHLRKDIDHLRSENKTVYSGQTESILIFSNMIYFKS